MPARRVAGGLGLIAGLTVIIAAFLPRVVSARADFVFRDVDLELRTLRWVLPLVFVLVHTLLYAVPSVGLLSGRRSHIATGVLLGVAIFHTTTSIVGLFIPDPFFDPGIGQWLGAGAGVLALVAGILALRWPVEESPERTPPPGEARPV